MAHAAPPTFHKLTSNKRIVRKCAVPLRNPVLAVLIAMLVSSSCAQADELLFPEAPTPEPTPTTVPLPTPVPAPDEPALVANLPPSTAVELVVCLDASNSVAISDFESTRDRIANAIDEFSSGDAATLALDAWFLPMAPAPSIYVDPQAELSVAAVEAPPDPGGLDEEQERLRVEYAPDPIPDALFDWLLDGYEIVKEHAERREVAQTQFSDFADDVRALSHGGQVTFIGPCVDRGARLLEGGPNSRTVLVIVTDFVFSEEILPISSGAQVPEVWLVPTCGGPLDVDDSSDCDAVMTAFESVLIDAGYVSNRRVDIARLAAELVNLIRG